jgi:hypothetical protein
MNLKNNNKFISTASGQIPIITGIIYINNDIAVDEKDIEDTLGAAYPDLKLFFKTINKVPSAKYVILNNDGSYDLLGRKSLGDNENVFPAPLTLSQITQTDLDTYDTRYP